MNHSLMITFCPLYYLDRRFWHKEDWEDWETYPINEAWRRKSINQGE